MLCVLLGCLAAGDAYGQTATITAATGQSCAGTRFGSSLNCTANDFSSSLTFDQPAATALASCIAGSTVSIDVIAQTTSNSPIRYDGAYFIGEVGNSPSLADATKTCSLGVFPTTPSPFLNLDADGCGDYSATSNSTLLIEDVAIRCTPAAGTNVLNIPYTLVFSNQVGSTACTPSNVTANTTAKCVSSNTATVTGVTVNAYVRITKQTSPDGHSQSFSFTATESGGTTVSPSSFTLSDGQTRVVEVPFSSTGGGRTLNITETLATGWQSTASIVCTTPSGGSASSYVTTNNATRGISAALTTTNFGADCTITNTKIPTVKVQKTTSGGFGGPFAFSQGNLTSAPADISTTAVATAAPVSPAAIDVTTIGNAVTLTETAASGYRLTGASCTDAASALTNNTGTIGSLSGSTLTIPAANVKAGSEYTCVFTNAKIPTVKVQKITTGAAGGPFAFTKTNLTGSIANIATASAGTAAPVSPAALDVTTIGSDVTISESAVSGFQLTGASCTDANSSVTGNTGTIGSLSGSTLTIPAANVKAGADFTCTFTNRRTPTVKLQKITAGGAGGPFGFSQVNLASTPTAITTTAAATATPASPSAIAVTTTGNAVQITENSVVPGFQLLSASCTDANSAITGNSGAIGSLSGTTLTIPAANVVAGADFTCVFTNAKTPTLKLQKITAGGTGGPFTFSQTNLASTPSGISTVSIGTATPASPTSIAVLATGSAITLTESSPSGFAIATASCTDANSAITGNSGTIGTLSGSTLSIAAASVVAGADFTCTFTNAKIPTVKVQKITTGGTGGPFAFSQTNLAGTPAAITTTAAGTATPASPAAINVTSTGTAVTLTEAAVPGFVLSSASCSDANSAITGNSGAIGTLSGTVLTIPAANVKAGADFTCVFTNAAGSPQLSLAKSPSAASVNAAGTAITYTLTVANPGTVTIISITVSDALGSVSCATSGDATIASLAPTQTEICTLVYAVPQAAFDNNGGGDGDIDNSASVSASYFGTPVTASADAAVALVRTPQLTLVKTANTAGPAAKDDVLTYTYTVRNTGNLTISGITISDIHNGNGTLPVPGNEVIASDVAPFGDSADASVNGTWDSLSPGDSITFTAAYLVTQADVDLLQ